jgi:uncharacterized membrane protein
VEEPAVPEAPAGPRHAAEPSAEPLAEPARATWWIRLTDPPAWVLGALAVVWFGVFYELGTLRHDRFGTFGFDLGIYDQGTWLVSQGLDPFVTVRGIDLFGHHMNVVLLAVAPLYRLGGGTDLLLALQLASQAAGAAAVFLLARDRTASRWVGVALGAVLLLNPTYQYLAWEYFHPDALAIAPLLFAYWAARERRWGWFTVAAVLAVACKEDVALAVLVIGLLVVLRGGRRAGAIIAAAAAAWFVVATRLLIPWFNGIGPFYDSFFGELGDSPGEIARNVVAHPGRTFELVTEPDRLSYYGRLFAPFAFVPLAALHVLAVGLPMLGVNVLTEYPHTRNYRFHYSSLVVAAMMIATVEVVGWLRRRRVWMWALTGVVLATALWTSVLWGPSPIGREYDTGIWPLHPDPRTEVFERAVALVPDDASTSAIYNFVPHMTHRRRIYEFPVPWRNVNWGVDGENLHDPAGVEWIAVDRLRLGPADLALLDELLATEFEVRLDEADVVVAERIAPPPPAPLFLRH